jgi:hypothetical protein
MLHVKTEKILPFRGIQLCGIQKEIELLIKEREKTKQQIIKEKRSKSNERV